MTSEAVPYAARRAAARTRKRAGGPRIVPLVLFTMLVVAIFFAMIYLRIAMDRSAFELDTVNDMITLEESRTLDLRLELAQLQNPERIATQASQIGLVYPQQQIAVIVPGVAPHAAVVESEDAASALGTDAP